MYVCRYICCVAALASNVGIFLCHHVILVVFECVGLTMLACKLDGTCIALLCDCVYVRARRQPKTSVQGVGVCMC